MAVDFETKCYENDWQVVLAAGYLRTVVDRCAYPFSQRRLIVNNVNRRSAVETAAKAAIERGELDAYLFVEDHADAALQFFELERTSFGIGYTFSISELVGLYASRAEYLLHFASDCYPKRRYDWIGPAVEQLESRHDFVVANLCWNNCYPEAEAESCSRTEKFFVGVGFSDQCYLAKMSVFRTLIYNERNIASERYPEYGGELFEKRADAYMRNHGLKRLTHRYESYVHRNIPKSGIRRAIRQLLPFY